jgi:hypothetical protein
MPESHFSKKEPMSAVYYINILTALTVIIVVGVICYVFKKTIKQRRYTNIYRLIWLIDNSETVQQYNS